ncbi:MAG: hypothetical protein K2N47_03940 [Clostridia bacterium]|nr:hypothetical protein [Clostridia bacterium]
MEDEFFTQQINYTKKRKALLEAKDIFAGVAFPFILMIVLSSSIITFADSQDLMIYFFATIGGEILTIASLIIFGRANGAAAYGKTIENMQKREINSKDEKVYYRTGEYAIWKAVLIGAILCAPFIIFQTIELCYDNSVCMFCLKYLFGWAYYPFYKLGSEYQALNYLMILMPIGVHTLGYYFGKLKRIKVQKALEKTNMEKKGRKK